MAESTLSGTRDDIRSAVGYHLGYGRTSSSWTAAQVADIDDNMKTGVRFMTATPAVKLGSGLVVTTYQWSWLTPVQAFTVWPAYAVLAGRTVTTTTAGVSVAGTGTTVFYPSMVGKTITINAVDYVVASYVNSTTITLTTAVAAGASGLTWAMAADGAYRLPDDFGGINGKSLTYAPSVNNWSIQVVGEPQIRETYQIDTSVGRPCYAATRPAYMTGASPQRWDIFLYPIPDAVYVLSVPYFRIIDAMSASLPYPLGGMPYYEAFKDACLAAAEISINDTKGLRWEQFMTTLASAIEHDAGQHGPRNLGKSQSGYGENGPYKHPNNNANNAYYNGVQT